MLGRTHVSAGVTAALLVLHPTTVLGVGAAIAGGALGGMICDIDCKGSERNRETIRGALCAAGCIVMAVVYDICYGNGLIANIRNAVGMNLIIGCLGMLACCIWGCLSPHRTFTHSLLGLLTMGFSVWLISAPLGYAFCAGMASHILLDLLNHRKIPLLYPLKKPAVSFGICDAGGIVNTILLEVFSAASVLLLFYFTVPADVRQKLFGWLVQ